MNCASQVEARLVQSYQGSKAADLEAELEQYLHGDGFDWASAPLPGSIREAAVELVNALVGHQMQSQHPQSVNPLQAGGLSHKSLDSPAKCSATSADGGDVAVASSLGLHTWMMQVVSRRCDQMCMSPGHVQQSKLHACLAAGAEAGGMQAEVEAEVYSGAPQLRVEVMTDVMTHLLTQLSEQLTEHLQGILNFELVSVAAGSGLGGCVQLLLELQFLEAALPFYAAQPAVDELLTHVQEILVAVIQVQALMSSCCEMLISKHTLNSRLSLSQTCHAAASAHAAFKQLNHMHGAKAGTAHSAQQGQLERWAGKAHGLQLTDRVLEKSSQLSAAATDSVRMNVACFQEAAAAGA
ncbi:hypothetical protein MMC07_006812 [Pseudocyphellaria aurata]|nr:hypothetical protein [Pseudocyphellaria aurata]